MSSKRERDDGSESGEDDQMRERRDGKRKANRACDSCRKKKHRCDGDTSEAPCSTCKSLGLSCTYLESSTRKAVPKGYVEALEARIATLMSIVAQDRPDVDLERLLGGPLVLDPASFNVRRPAGQSRPKDPPSRVQSDLWQPPKSSRSPSMSGGSGPPAIAASTSTSHHTNPASGPSVLPPIQPREPRESSARDEIRTKDKGDSEDELIRQFVRLDRPDEIAFRSFLGKSSSLPLVRSAIIFKYGANVTKFTQECALHPLAMELSFRTPAWEHPSEPLFASNGSVFDGWPEPALASSLIELYFAHCNEALPLLQRSHFLRQYASQLYFRDEGFARVCLLVFARGAGYSDDPRVRSVNEDGDLEPARSAGWIYYHALKKIAQTPLKFTALSDLQVAVLHATFLQVQGSKATRPWPVIGAGLKAAIEVGAHRRGSTRSKDLTDNELMRKAFWCLYLLDVQQSVGLGRPLTLNEDEFDVECEFDHAFWQDGAKSHPSSPPSAVQAFCLEVDLARILARTLTLLFSIRRPHKSPLEIVSDLEGQIKDWTASVPAHLRWDPSRPNSLEFRLAAELHMLLQSTLSYIHRPFLPSPQHPVSTSPQSITAAFNAALESIAVYDALYQKIQVARQSSFLIPHNAGTILLLCVWAGPATHEFADPAEAMEAIEKVVYYIQLNVERFSGLSDAIVPKSVLAAPRVDYLVESLAKRQDRERRANQALEMQRQHRMEAAERSSNSPAGGPSPNSAFYSSPSGGSGPYTRSPSTVAGGPPPPSSADSTPFDLMEMFALGGDFMFPDLPSDHDPAMTLFLQQQPTTLPQQPQPNPPNYNYPFPAVPLPGQVRPPFFNGGGSSWASGGMPNANVPR